MWIEIVALANRCDPELYRQLLAYPEDLPDLTRLRPPDGNIRPEGVKESCLEQKRLGTLPETY